MRSLPFVLVLLSILVSAQDKDDAVARGRAVYRQQACWQCHVQGRDKNFPPVDGSRRAGPVLDAPFLRRSREWHLAHFFAPRATVPESTMPSYEKHFRVHGKAAEVRAFVERYDTRDRSMHEDGIVTKREFERAGGERWEESLARLDTGNGAISLADARPAPTPDLEALLAYVKSLERTPPAHPAARHTPVPVPAPMEAGEKLYLRFCAGCHGERADGNGPAAPLFGDHPPRNFLRGEYKFRSTLAPDPPLPGDLYRSIRYGAGPSMPAWPNLADWQIWALVEFLLGNHPDFLPHELFVEEAGKVVLEIRRGSEDVDSAAGENVGDGRVQKRAGRWYWVEDGVEKRITDGMEAGKLRFRIGKPVFDWFNGKQPQALAIGEAPFPFTAESAAIGARVYKEFGCRACHGPEGKGDGSAAGQGLGGLGQVVMPTDYSRGALWLKGGADARSLVRTFRTGMHGTPMPAFGNEFARAYSAPPKDAPWHLAHFIMRQARIPFQK